MGISEITSTIPVIAALIAPGYLWLLMEGRIASTARISRTDLLLRQSIYAVIFYGLLYHLNPLAASKWGLQSLEAAMLFASDAAKLLWVVICAGLITGVARRQDWMGLILRKLRLPAPINGGLTPWQSAFCRKKACMVRLTLADGEDRYVEYGIKSNVGDGDVNSELFFESAYYANGDGNLVPDETCNGFWISRSSIQIVRFYERQKLEIPSKQESVAGKNCTLQERQASTDDIPCPRDEALSADPAAFAANVQSIQQRELKPSKQYDPSIVGDHVIGGVPCNE